MQTTDPDKNSLQNTTFACKVYKNVFKFVVVQVKSLRAIFWQKKNYVNMLDRLQS